MARLRIDWSLWREHRSRVRWAAAGLVLLVLMLPQFRSLYDMAEERAEELAPADRPLVVGVSWPSSNRGRGLIDGLERARDEILADPAWGGRAIEFVVRDDSDRPVLAHEIARQFAETKGMSAVIGYADDTRAGLAAGAYRAADLLQIVVGAIGSGLTRRDQLNLVRTIPAGETIMRSLAALIGPDPVRFAVVKEKDGAAEELAEEFTIARVTLGGRRIYDRAYPAAKPDFLRTAHELKRVEADFILFAGKARAAGDFLKLADRIGVEIPVICTCTNRRDLMRAAGPAVRGAAMVSFHDGAEDQWALIGYDALWLLAEAVRISGSTQPAELAYGLRYMAPFEGALGRYEFDETGQAAGLPVYLRRFLDGAGRSDFLRLPDAS